jgi:hypothetical protein
MRLPMVFIARALALVWAGFWIFFVVAESWVFRTPARLVLPWAGLLLLFLMVALAPWRWEVTGGVLLMGVGVLAGTAYTIWPPAGLPLASRVMTTVVFAGPPLLAGILFLIDHRAVTARAVREKTP